MCSSDLVDVESVALDRRLRAEDERIFVDFSVFIDLYGDAEERRTRSHRLIVRGAVFESIVPEAKTMTDEEAAALLRLALTSEPAREYLKKRAESGNAE